MPLMKNKILSWPCIANRKMSFDRIIQSLQDMDPNIQQVIRIDLRFQESNEIPEITIDNHKRQIAALSNVEQSNEAIMSYDNMINS